MTSSTKNEFTIRDHDTQLEKRFSIRLCAIRVTEGDASSLRLGDAVELESLRVLGEWGTREPDDKTLATRVKKVWALDWPNLESANDAARIGR